MNPLETAPQTIHQMVPVIFVLSFVLLAAVLVVARVVNWIGRRTLMNGGFAAFGLLVLAMLALVGLSLFHPKITLYGSRILGQGTAAIVPAAALSFFLGRRFRRKTKALTPPSGAEA